jgi:hypothetical protein
MTDFNALTVAEAGIVERAAVNVHSWWMTRKHTKFNGSAASRNDKTTELMVPYEDLPPDDQEDDRASVLAVVESFRKEGPRAVSALLWPHLTDDALFDALCGVLETVDPTPPDLAARSLDAVTRAGLDAAAVTRANDEANRDTRGDAW